MGDDPSGRPADASEPVHLFTVQRGMVIVLVIETTSWYAGLRQAALARIALEGDN